MDIIFMMIGKKGELMEIHNITILSAKNKEIHEHLLWMES